ncbi:GGDEF domain-containing protein [Jeotgalibaca sp. A127]|uniref:GGDEF domain-containing protein n=1 Tax=Jeotgalibaca sp. A127 TaxID=3457324 RepID=UPI003FCF44AC
MFSTIIANMAVIFMPIYFYFRSNYAISDKKNFTFQELSTFVVAETLVGVALIHLSVFFMGVPIDGRALFFSISMTYFGWKITLPSMLLVEAYHLYVTGHAPLLMGLVSTFVFASSMYVVKIVAAKRLEAYGQLIVLILYNVVLKSLTVFFVLRDLPRTILFFCILGSVSYVIMSGLYLQMNDLRILRERSDYDYLTRLLNVRKFKERLEILEKNRQIAISIALIDLDLFKTFNDTYGHAAGDKILWGVAQVLSAYSAPNALTYRVGGEEFAIVMVGMTRKEAELLIVDVMDNVVNRPIPLNREQLTSVTLSVGLAFSEEGESLNRLWKRADRAMYQSKENGRNQLTVSSGSEGKVQKKEINQF